MLKSWKAVAYSDLFLTFQLKSKLIHYNEVVKIHCITMLLVTSESNLFIKVVNGEIKTRCLLDLGKL